MASGLPQGSLWAGGFPAPSSQPCPREKARWSQGSWGAGSRSTPPPFHPGQSRGNLNTVEPLWLGSSALSPDSVPVLRRSLGLCEDKGRVTLPPDSSPVPKTKTAGTLFLFGMLCWQDSQFPAPSPSLVLVARDRFSASIGGQSPIGDLIHPSPGN